MDEQEKQPPSDNLPPHHSQLPRPLDRTPAQVEADEKAAAVEVPKSKSKKK